MRKTLHNALIAALFLMVLSFSAWAQTSRASVSAAEVNGTFKMNFSGKYKDFSNDLKILAVGAGRLRIAFDLVFPYLLPSDEIIVNLGTLDAEAAIVGDTATYTSEDSDCMITLKFVKPGTVKVMQKGSDAACGFGHRVYSEGIYQKVNAKKPKFDLE